MFKKNKQKFKEFITRSKSGFSLVELIVVIAIMAVMAAILAPALLGYVEKSRAQKDDSAMDEVVSALQLSLADQEIYDEVLEHSVWDNISCYVDQQDESLLTDYKISLKAANVAANHAEQYTFSDEARLLDETVYFAAGNMRGLTITWSPNESGDTYDFSKGILNKFVGRKTGYLSENPELYNRLRSVIGDKLNTTSQTYRNSDYTIFIRVGSTGGNEAVMQDAIQVWGQFNGTNLAEKDHKYSVSKNRDVGIEGASDYLNNAIQQGLNSSPHNFGENGILTLKIDGQEYQYEKNMTWREWFNSDYNTSNWYIINIGNKELITRQSDIEYCSRSTCGCSSHTWIGGIREDVVLLNFHALMPSKRPGGETSTLNNRVTLDTPMHLPVKAYSDCIEDYSLFRSYGFGCGDSVGGGVIFGDIREVLYEIVSRQQ